MCNSLESEGPGSVLVNEFIVVVVAVLKVLPAVITVGVLHCTSAGFGVHWPVLLHVLVMGFEGNSPSSHWKVTEAPSVHYARIKS